LLCCLVALVKLEFFLRALTDLVRSQLILNLPVRTTTGASRCSYFVLLQSISVDQNRNFRGANDLNKTTDTWTITSTTFGDLTL
jgi:hypothetical protein